MSAPTVMFRRPFAGVMLALFFLAFHGLPCANAVTLGEKAGARESSADKAPARKGEDPAGKTVREAPADLFERSTPPRVASPAQERKDPRLACILSLIMPGAGHVYLRRDLKGVGFCMAAAASYATAGYFLYETVFGSYRDSPRTGIIITSLLFLVAAIIHVVSIVEAYADAEEMNKKDSFGLIPDKNRRNIAKIVIE